MSLRERRTHTHSCQYASAGCTERVGCYDYFLEKNYDGWPEVICTYNERENIPCETCDNADLCDDCGIPEHLAHDLDCPYWERERYDVEVPIEAYVEFDYYDRRVS